MIDGTELNEEFDKSWEQNGVLIPFDQREFMGDHPALGKYTFNPRGMTDFGWLYYPKSCI